MQGAAGMTREDAIADLRALYGARDTEQAHVEADAVLCKMLTDLGYADVVRAWEHVKKWYA